MSQRRKPIQIPLYISVFLLKNEKEVMGAELDALVLVYFLVLISESGFLNIYYLKFPCCLP
jgi:hypothetical protein